jgi:hypothetical protein
VYKKLLIRVTTLVLHLVLLVREANLHRRSVPKTKRRMVCSRRTKKKNRRRWTEEKWQARVCYGIKIQWNFICAFCKRVLIQVKFWFPTYSRENCFRNFGSSSGINSSKFELWNSCKNPLFLNLILFVFRTWLRVNLKAQFKCEKTSEHWKACQSWSNCSSWETIKSCALWSTLLETCALIR